MGERMHSCDLAILGGGPAGCAAALAALRASPGLSVTIVDRDAVPRHRIGEALLTGTVMALDRLGVAEAVAAAGFHRKIGAAYVWGDSPEPWYVNYPRDHGDYPSCFVTESGARESIHVTRHAFDALLRREAEKAGASIMTMDVRSVSFGDSSSSCRRPAVLSVSSGDGTTLRARRWIDCTGQGAVIGKALSMRRPVGVARSARYAYSASIDWERAIGAGFDPHRTNIVSSPFGWAWVIHLGESGGGLTSVGLVSTPDALSGVRFSDASDMVPALRSFGFDDGFADPRDAYGVPTSDWIRHPDYSYFCDALHGPNWSLAGDAALFLDPILSQGVTLAMHYATLRGEAAAGNLDGAIDGVTEERRIDGHYMAEASVLRRVVGEWYGNNRHVGDWKLASVMIGETEYGRSMEPDAAFRWVTNLENLRDEYDPYPLDQRLEVARRLGL